MQTVQIFDLASSQARWLSVRQSTVASNIANANTPGYVVKDVESFDKVLSKTFFGATSTQAGHIDGNAGNDRFAVRTIEGDAPLLPSGNTVVMEEELVKQGEVRHAFELNTAIVKSFHRMIMMTTRP